MKINGLDSLVRKLNEAQEAAQELDGDLASLKFDPFDPASIEEAIQQLNAAVDQRLAPYRENELVKNMGEQLKENGREAIINRAASARLEKGE
ncbi:hypothetical protein [Phenylobacterium sp.]|uniref:hypothetical protein n=1 Tax=Phenylobacterium sp. TaxID=1871053 RepID=UPI0025D8ADDA|nr:hypothetical protein [Phenylobacterium sp.]MBX3483465.1 hypothetical protein [Phenylobacterium sp.]MCW5759925.1 hypothetical protein [Phenylobacterium sp.]